MASLFSSLPTFSNPMAPLVGLLAPSMKTFCLLFACCLSLLFSVDLFADESFETFDEPHHAASARRQLDDWQATDAKPAERVLHLICWTPADREPPAEYESRLSQIMLHIQAFYESQMDKLGFGKRTFNLQKHDAKRLVIHLVRGRHPTSHYTKGSGREIREECRKPLKELGVDINRETIVIFCNLASWNEKTLKFSHESPYYASGSARGGTAWQLDSPELAIPNLVKVMPLVFDGQYGRISMGKHNSIFIGGIAHELGHALGLPHNTGGPDQAGKGTPLMGSGNRTYGDELRGEGRGSVLSFAHAMRLASHPQFSGSIKGLETPANSKIEELRLDATGNELTITGVIDSDPPVYGVVAYLDPSGGGDYNAQSAATTPNETGRFRLTMKSHYRGKPGQLRIVLLHANGHTTSKSDWGAYQYDLEVNKNGEFDLSLFRVQMQLTPIANALARRDVNKAKSLTAEITDEQAKAIADRWLANPPRESPKDYTGDEATIALTQTKPAAAKVGWSSPTFNHLPSREMVLVAASKPFVTGIYAHAPARHQYELGKRWKGFSGKVGIANQQPGSVQFQIKGDGRLLWTSKVIKAGELQAFSIEVDEIDSLELVASPTDDGNRADWGLWLDPQLHR